MWRELISNQSPAAKFSPSVAVGALAQAQIALNVQFPAELVDVLRESDGIQGEYGLGLLWPLAQVVTENLKFRTQVDFRTLYMPFDHLLFFADAGNGDQFAFTILEGQIRRSDIFVWNHETDSRTWVAPSLETYFDWWLSGRIKV